MPTRDELGLRLLQEAAKRVAEWQEAFEQYVEEARRSGLVKELYLISSRARGEHLPSSDFDLLAVVSRGADPLEVAEKLRLLKKRSLPLDIVVLTEEELEDPIYSEMLRGRKKLL
ncbi:MAG: nucleotidyltransferase domain-containing protein [Thermofilum sp.]